MATRHREDTVLEAKKSKVKPPPMFKVLLLNDDYTPMEVFRLEPGKGDAGDAQGAPRRHRGMRHLPQRRCGNQG
jgi:hypothetical protein